MIYFVLIGFFVVGLYVICIKRSIITLSNEHILITGGSSGIGLAFAIEAVKKGASVTLLARNKEKLDAAQKEVLQHIKLPEQKVSVLALDISCNFTDVESAVKQIEEERGPITFLVNCAGTSNCCRFEETPLNDFQKMLNVNYLGSVYVTRAVLPSMKSRKNGRIVFVSSMAGLVGIYGYTAYSSSKFALMGLAQALQMEVKPYNVSITLCFPPDTDTPGFAEESKVKPLETQRISQYGGFFSAQEVSSKMLQDSMEKYFMSSVGLEGWLLCNLCSGMSPMSSFTKVLLQIFTMGASRLVGIWYHIGCDRIVQQCTIEKNDTKKTE